MPSEQFTLLVDEVHRALLTGATLTVLGAVDEFGTAHLPFYIYTLRHSRGVPILSIPIPGSRTVEYGIPKPALGEQRKKARALGIL
jgi:hypothetical protein